MVVFETQLMMDILKRLIIPQAKEEAEESYPNMDPQLAIEEIRDETLPEIPDGQRLVSIYYLENVHFTHR